MVVNKVYEAPSMARKQREDKMAPGVEPVGETIRGKDFDYVPNMSLGRRLMAALVANGDNISQIYTPTGETHTFAEIRTKSINVAVEMQHRGIGLGDVISICSYNQPNVCPTLLGSLFSGSVLSPLDPTLSVFDMKHLLNITRPKIVFSELECVAKIEQALDELHIDAVIVVYGTPKSARHVPFATFLQPRCDENEFKVVDFEDPFEHLAVIMSSSGTTGLPKGVALSHGNIIMSLEMLRNIEIKNVNFMNMSTLFWISGLIVIVSSIEKCFCRILTPPFEPEYCLQMIEKYKVFWILFGVTYYMKMVRHPNARKYDYSSVRVFAVSGGKLSKKSIDHGFKMFTNATFNTPYGVTETCGSLFEMTNAKPESIGYVATGIEAKIIDIETQQSLGPNKHGELCVRGGVIFTGYYDNQEATDEVKDVDGWLHTGDLCWYDDDRCFYIIGRIKEQFKCKGWQISPNEMENVLIQKRDIEHVAVIGVPHEEDVTRARAYIVKMKGSTMTEEDVHQYMKERMSPNKQLLGGIVFLAEMPFTPSGKIQRRTLHEMARGELAKM